MYTSKTAPEQFLDYYPITYDFRENNENEVKKLVEEVKERIEYNWISCYVVDPLTDSLEKMDLDESGFNMIDVIQFQSGCGLSAWVAEQKRPILLSSVHRGQRFHSNPVKSFVCCPIIRNGETIGVINLGHIQNQAYNKKILNQLLEILNPSESNE